MDKDAMTLSYKLKNKLKPANAAESEHNLGEAAATLCDPDNKAWCDACKELLLPESMVEGECAFRKQNPKK
ncbi:hypothetical protein ACMXYO_08135 [Neptuniibacter sp. QD37_6]|uniref:hypothetical protein n=1 Tax=Neptuniibacter sp. QD37_6 TaxID=3398210 RepID=UPI0039F609DD